MLSWSNQFLDSMWPSLRQCPSQSSVARCGFDKRTLSSAMLHACSRTWSRLQAMRNPTWHVTQWMSAWKRFSPEAKCIYQLWSKTIAYLSNSCQLNVSDDFQILWPWHIMMHVACPPATAGRHYAIAQCCIYQQRISLRWRHNGRDSVSNHQPHDCLLNRLFFPFHDVVMKHHGWNFHVRKTPCFHGTVLSCVLNILIQKWLCYNSDVGFDIYFNVNLNKLLSKRSIF